MLTKELEKYSLYVGNFGGAVKLIYVRTFTGASNLVHVLIGS